MTQLNLATLALTACVVRYRLNILAIHHFLNFLKLTCTPSPRKEIANLQIANLLGQLNAQHGSHHSDYDISELNSKDPKTSMA